MNATLPTILISAHPGHAVLIKALEGMGKYRVVVFGGAEFNGHVQAARESFAASAPRHVAGWSQALNERLGGHPFHVSGRNLSASLVPSLEALLLPSFSGFAVLMEACDRLHRESPIQAVVVHNDVAPNLRLLLAWADRLGIPTLHLPHGIAQSRFAMADFDDLIRTTVVGVQGRYTEEWYLENPKNSPDRIVPIGRPEWDAYQEAPEGARAAARRELGLDPARKVVGYVGNWAHTLTTFDLAGKLQEAVRCFLRAVVSLGAEAPQILIRPHPAHAVLGDFGPEFYQRLAAETGVEIILPEISKEAFLGACDLIVGLDSTMIVEALLAKRFAMSIGWHQIGRGDGSGYDGLPGIATCGIDQHEIETTLRACLYDETVKARLAAGRDETIERFNFKNDGKAIERAVALIDTLVSSAPKFARVPDGGYYGRINQRLASMVPESAKRILEVGCAAGYLGAYLKEQDPGREVIGVEAFPEAAREAQMRLDAVIEGDVETLALPFDDGSFDCILYGDVLEHLKDPGAVLAAHRRLLAPDGQMLVCIPNIGHWSVIRSLLQGEFTYTDEGLLDRTHVRFFTPKSFAQLLADSGLKVLEADTIDIPNVPMAQALEGLAAQLGIDHPQLTAQSNAYQLLFRATHAAAVGLGPEVADLPDRRAFNVVFAPDSPAEVHGVLESYLASFEPGADAALHILCSTNQAGLHQAVLAALAALGRDPEHIPDVALLDAPAHVSELPRYLRAADVVVGPSHVTAWARRLGKPALEAPSADDLRVLQGLCRSVDFHQPASPIETAACERWLVSDPVAWEGPLATFLQHAAPGGNAALVIRVEPGQAASSQEAIAAWLEANGHDLEAIPDVVLVEASALDVGLYRQATACVDPRGPARMLARALGLPLLDAETIAAQRPGACSVVVVSYNSMDTLEACLDSTLATLGPDDELIVVDNASVDGTIEYLRRRSGSDPRLQVHLSPTNLGFSAGSNLGLRAAKGDYLVLLNPDTVVTPGWLDRMRRPFADSSVGAVGPTSDYVAGLQKYQLYLPQSQEQDPERIAERVAERNAGVTVETKLLIGFCMMLSRRALDEVGLLDEELFLGNDDLDLSWRLRERDFRLLVAADAFVHHVGQVSFNTEPGARTKQLVQESTDALARKLVRYYGAGQVPSCTELWNISWFSPSPGILEGTAPTPEAYVASIVVLTFNQLEVTQLCFESLYRHTKNFELVVVDNNSTDGTVEYLTTFAAAHDNVQLILNASNRGFAGGCNQGMAAARGRDIVLLNNDTVVSEGWLEGLIEASRIEGVGLVGPRTNCIVGPQLVEEVSYDQQTLEGFEPFARSWRQEHAGVVTAAHRVIGFCMLIRREVIDRIGALDTSFGKGNYEDDDYCMRAGLAGFQIGIVEWVFIHHFGSVTFRGQKIDYQDLIRENWKRFRQKWLLPDTAESLRGYRFADVKALPFDPQLHTEPVYSAQVPPAPLPDSRAFNIVLADRDLPRLRTAILSYLQAFSEGDDVALHVLAGRDAERVHGELLDVIAGHGLDPEHIPEISLLDVPDVPLDLPAYLASADLVVGSPHVTLGARDMGLPAFDEPSADSLRLAFESFAGLDWGAPPLPLGERAQERWLLAWSPAWERGLETFLGAVSPDQDIALLLRVKPGEAGVVFETLTRWLEDRGLDPEAIPDVVLIDQPTDSEVSVYRQATAWLDNGDPLGAAMARALGLRVIASREDPALHESPVAGRN